MRGGELFPLPPPELPTEGNGSSSLLPTPVVNDMGAGQTPQQWDEWVAAMRDRHGNGNGHGPSLAVEAQRLMGTPTATAGARSVNYRTEGGACRVHNPAELAQEMPDTFGPYQAAVERWERVQGRPAPAPAADGRLNPVFVEWLMGLDRGWVTGPDLGLSRTQQLKALGNGVVPQQALLALHLITESLPNRDLASPTDPCCNKDGS
jgi:DNA (cytosine-5)-methyltransferase 1